MPNIDEVVRVGRNTYAWGSSRFLLDGLGYEGFKSIDLSQKLEVEKVWAARPDGKPVAFAGNGKYSVDGFKWTVLKDTAALMKAQLAAGGSLRPGLGSYGDAVFVFMAQCVEPIVGSLPITMVASWCKVASVAEKRDEGTGAIVEEWGIECLELIENGIPLWSIQRGLI